MKLPKLVEYPIGFICGLLLLSRIIIQALLWVANDVITLNLRHRVTLDECQMVINWVKTQNIPLNTACKLQLPSHLAYLAKQGLVQVLHTANGRHCVLLKTYIGYKSNFEGTFYCDGPLLTNEIYPIDSGRDCIYLNGEKSLYHDFYYLYVRKRCDDDSNYFEVYFDLN